MYHSHTYDLRSGCFKRHQGLLPQIRKHHRLEFPDPTWSHHWLQNVWSARREASTRIWSSTMLTMNHGDSCNMEDLIHKYADFFSSQPRFRGMWVIYLDVVTAKSGKTTVFFDPPWNNKCCNFVLPSGFPTSESQLMWFFRPNRVSSCVHEIPMVCVGIIFWQIMHIQYLTDSLKGFFQAWFSHGVPVVFSDQILALTTSFFRGFRVRARALCAAEVTAFRFGP